MGFCSLRVLIPPAREPVELPDARAHLRLDMDDPTLPGFLAAARSWAEQYLNRALITQTLRYTLSPSQPPSGSLGGVVNPIIFVMPLSWWPVTGQPIELPMAPVQSVVAVTQRTRDGSVRTLGAADFFADVDNEPARLTLRTIGQPLGSDLSITYKAGYGDEGRAVPVPIVQAIKILTTFFYEHRGDDDAGEPPMAVKMLLGPFRQVTFA